MTTTDYLGTEFIGQERARKQINFFIDYQRKKGFIPSILFSSNRGSGKTLLAKLITNNLLNEFNERKPAIHINGSSLQKLGDFVNEVVIPHVHDFKDISIHIDEIHCCSKDVLNWLLTVLQPDKEGFSTAFFRGQEFIFDFKKFSFLASSTNTEKLSFPLLSRFRIITFEPYKEIDLIKILIRNTQGIVYKDSIEKEIVRIGRGSPRETIHRGNDVIKFCEHKSRNEFNVDDWMEFKDIMGILPLGLTFQEIELLRFLQERGPQTLTAISGKMSLDSVTIRRNIELYLLSQGLINIAGKRHITLKGQKVLKEIEKSQV